MVYKFFFSVAFTSAPQAAAPTPHRAMSGSSDAAGA